MPQQINKSAFLFPGQGLLPHDVIEYYSFLKTKDKLKTEKFISTLQTSLDEINLQAMFNVIKILEKETALQWNRTDFVQPLTYTLSILTYELMRDKGQSDPSYMLGHSLGAFSALTAAGSLPFERGCRIVAARGKFMQEESEMTNEGMIAVIGLTEDKIKNLSEKTKSAIALINGPTAFVLGAPRDSFSQIEQEAVLLGASKTIRLATSGAFHTDAMLGAYKKFKGFLEQDKLQKPRVPVVVNMKGTASLDPDELKNDIIESIINPINWTRMMDFLKSNSVDSYIEVGPGTSLTSLSRINGVERDRISHARTILE